MKRKLRIYFTSNWSGMDRDWWRFSLFEISYTNSEWEKSFAITMFGWEIDFHLNK